jgi:hypothetical protein
MTESTTPAIAALLLEVLDELRLIRAELAGQRRPSHLTREDRDRLATMLPAIGGAFGSELFLVRELFEADAAAVRLVLRGFTPKRVGRLLQRGEGQVIDGYLVQRGGLEVHVVLWRIVQVPEFSEARNLFVPSPEIRSLRQ